MAAVAAPTHLTPYRARCVGFVAGVMIRVCDEAAAGFF